MDLEPIKSHRTQPRPAGTQGPWAQWDVLGRGDIIAAVLGAVATVFSAGSLLWGQRIPHSFPNLHEMTPPLCGVLFFLAMLAMFADRERHGIARTLFAAGAVVLAIAGGIGLGQIPAGRLITFYWLPAIFAMSAAIELFRVKRATHHESTPIHVHPGAPRRR